VGLTGSRGPLLGLFISALGMVYLIKVHFAEKFRLALIPLGVGGLSLLASILLSPARERIGANMAGDNSVLNRLEIWKASGQIIGNTHGGVGYGESGYFYSQWFQSFGGEYVYTGLLNSYFEIAVEFGGIVLLAGIFIASVLAYSLAGIRLKAGGSNLLKPLAVCAGTSLLGIAVCALTSSAHTYAVVRLIVLLDAAILVVWLVVFRKMLAWKKVIACAGLSVLAVASGLFAWGKVYENRYEVKASLGPWGVVHLWKEGRTESGRHLLVMPDRAELGHLYGKKIRTMLLLNKQYFDFWVCDPRKPLPKSLPAGDYDVLVFGEAVQWLQGLKAPGMKRWHVVNPRGDYCGAPEGVEMVVWLPEFDVLGKDGPWRENKGNAHLRESKSRGGVISMADIKNMEGFLEL
jgi:hypothetical protein